MAPLPYPDRDRDRRTIPDRWRMEAMIWPDATELSGWRRLVWQPDTSTGRGWLIPERLGYADVIEFGSDPTGAQRWYGIVESYEPGTWLTLQGPFPTPGDANRAATELLSPDEHIPQPRTTAHSRSGTV